MSEKATQSPYPVRQWSPDGSVLNHQGNSMTWDRSTLRRGVDPQSAMGHPLLRNLAQQMGGSLFAAVATLGLLGLGALTGAQPALSQEFAPRTLIVSGQGVVSIPTSLTQVELGVEAEGDSPTEVQQVVAERSTALLDLLRSLSVRQLQTTGLRLSPRYDYSNGNQRLVGYTATNQVRFEVPNDEVGTLLDQAVQAGASRIDNLNFVATEAAIAEARQQALIEATQDAEEQADTVLQSLGLKRQDIQNIQVQSSLPTAPGPYLRTAALDAASTPVVAGQQQIEASVTIHFTY